VTTWYATTSHRLALDVQRLLLRLKVRSTIGSSKRHHRAGFTVRIQGARAQARFLRVVGCHGQRGDCIPAALEILDAIEESPNVDLVPRPVACQLKAAAAMAGVTQAQIAEALGSLDVADIATSDLYWDEIVEITAAGEEPTFDLTIEGNHNFLADGIVAHNSLEQDADVVMFLYRDEVYNSESPDRGTAEVIISKHRNGPTGVTHLAFLDHYTRFANMARV
jgi:replicative DNA helicase